LSSTLTIGALVGLPAATAALAIAGGSVLQVVAPLGLLILLTQTGVLDG